MPFEPDQTTDATNPAQIAPQLRALAVPLDGLILHPRNARRGDVGAIAASLGRFGQRKPVVVQASTHYVVAGNHLVAAARSLGWEEIAANVQDMDDAEAAAYMLADNRTADLGGYDESLLAEILAEQADLNNLLATGYDADDIAALLRAAGIADRRGDPDGVPDRPAPEDVYVRPGDLWSLGRHRLVVGDARDPVAVERVTNGGPVELLWTDPPYGVDYQGGSRKRTRIANDGRQRGAIEELLTTALGLAPVRRGRAFYVTTPTGPQLVEFLLALRATDLELHQTLVWVKDRFSPGRADYQARYEGILYGWRRGATHYFVADRTQDTVWEIPRPGRSDAHPTMKPVELVERAIRNSTHPGERVYDPFVGSGTTLIAAEITDRVGLAIELDPTYAQVALERWQAFSGQRATRIEDGQPVSPPVGTAVPADGVGGSPASRSARRRGPAPRMSAARVANRATD